MLQAQLSIWRTWSRRFFSLWICGLLGLSWACAPENRSFEAPLEQDAHYYWLLENEERRVLQFSPPLIVVNDQVVSHQIPLLEASLSDQNIRLLAIPHGPVRSETPFLAPEEPLQLSLALEATGKAEWKQTPMQRSGQIWAPLSEHSQLFDVPEETKAPLKPSLQPFRSTAAFRNLRQVIEVDPEHCAPDKIRPFEAYANKNLKVIEESEDEKLHDLRRVDFVGEDRVMAMARQRIYFVRQGEPFVQQIGGSKPNTLKLYDMIDTTPGEFRAQAVVPGHFGESPQVYIAAHQIDPGKTFLFKVTLDSSGVTKVETSTVIPDRRVSNLAVHTDGSLALAFFGGRTYHIKNGSLTKGRIPGFDGDSQRTFVFGQNSDHMYAATFGNVHEFTVASGWQRTTLPEGIHDDLRVGGITESSSGMSYWVGLSPSLFSKRGQEPWQETQLRFPPRAASCGAEPSAWNNPSIHLPLVAMKEFGEHLLVINKNCSGLFMIRKSDACVSILPFQGDGIALQTIHWRDIAVSPQGKVVISGRHGHLKLGGIRL